MKLALFGLLLVAVVPSAFATSVTYNTTGSELCVGLAPCGGALSQQLGDVIITFNPIASSTVDANPITFGSFGEIVISCFGGGAACAPVSVDTLNLFIVINQTVPDADTGFVVAGDLSGSVGGNASSAQITWASPNTVAVGSFPILYSIANSPLNLVPVTTNNGVTSIQAIIEDGNIPEPSTYLLLSAGLLGIGLRRKFAKRS